SRRALARDRASNGARRDGHVRRLCCRADQRGRPRGWDRKLRQCVGGDHRHLRHRRHCRARIRQPVAAPTPRKPAPLNQVSGCPGHSGRLEYLSGSAFQRRGASFRTDEVRSAKMRLLRTGIATAAATTLLFSAACSSSGGEAEADDATEIEIVAFSPPSLGAFLPAVIAEKRFDLDNDLDITFVERPPDAYNTEFSTGQYQVGGSGSLMSEAVRLSEGVDVVYLFNVHDYWGGLVSTTPEV